MPAAFALAAPSSWRSRLSPLSPEILEPVRRQGRIDCGARDRAMMTGARSAFDRPPAGGCDPDALDVDRWPGRSQRLSYHRCERSEHKPCQHVTREPMGEHKHFLGGAARTTGEQLEYPALFRAETMSSGQLRGQGPHG